MTDFSRATDSNIKRFQNLLDTSIDATERQVLQRLLAEEKAKAVPQASIGTREEIGSRAR